MKTFKQLLEDIRWQQETFAHVLNSFIPLTPKMMKRVFGKREKVKAFHISDFHNFKKLENLQGSKKSVSCGTNFTFDSGRYLTGIWAGGGIVSVIEGYPLVSSTTDAFSVPDKQGRRWINPIRLIQERGWDAQRLGNQITSELQMIRDMVLKKYTELPLRNDPRVTDFPNLDKKDKAKIIKEYIDTVEKTITQSPKNLKIYYDLFYNIDTKEPQSNRWTEHVLTEIKILKVYLMQNMDGSFTQAGMGYNINKYDKKYPTERIYHDQFDEQEALK